MNTYTRILFIAVVTSVIVSCSKESEKTIRQDGVRFTVTSGTPATKTGIANLGNGKYGSYWCAADRLSAWNTGRSTTEFMVLENTLPDGELAIFTGSGLSSENGTLRTFYPSDAISRADEDYVYFATKDVQYPTSCSFDPEADRLLSKEYSYQAVDGCVSIDDMRFHRLLAVMKVNILGEEFAGEVVKRLKLSFSYNIGGYYRCSTADMTTTLYNNPATTVAAIPREDILIGDTDNGAVYFLVPPGESWTYGYNLLSEVEVLTDAHLLKKSFSGAEVLLKPAEMAVVNITLTSENLVTEEGTHLAEYSSWGENVSENKFILHQNVKGVLCHPDGYQVKIDQDYDFEFEVADSETNTVTVSDESALTKINAPSLLFSGANNTTFERGGKFVKTLVLRPLSERWGGGDGYSANITLQSRTLSYIDTERDLTYQIDFPGISESFSFVPDHVVAEKDESLSDDTKTVYKVTCHYRIGVSYPGSINADRVSIESSEYYFSKTHYRVFNNE
mgnify:CR=1 FL=1